MSFPLSRDRIATITNGARVSGVSFPVTRERLEGFRQAAEDLGFAWKDVVVAVCARNDRSEAEQIAETLLVSPDPPDAIAAMSDEQAAGVVRAAGEAGVSIPGDVAVTGWDEEALSC